MTGISQTQNKTKGKTGKNVSHQGSKREIVGMQGANPSSNGIPEYTTQSTP